MSTGGRNVHWRRRGPYRSQWGIQHDVNSSLRQHFTKNNRYAGLFRAYAYPALYPEVLGVPGSVKRAVLNIKAMILIQSMWSVAQ